MRVLLFLVFSTLWVCPSLVDAEIGNVPNYDHRQPGEDVDSAIIIETLPFYDSGTTVGFLDDYEASCPYSSPAPDVIYGFTPTVDMHIVIDLCGSSFDTQLFVLDSTFQLVECNSDFYWAFPPCEAGVSRISDCFLTAGTTYFVAVDGGPGAEGAYELGIWEIGDCVSNCQGDEDEDEPPLFDGYVDVFNHGCSGGQEFFHVLLGNPDGNLDFCGRSGWYRTAGVRHRDWDVFKVVFGSGGTIDFQFNAEYSMELYAKNHCDGWDIADAIHVPPCRDGMLSVTGSPGDVLWLLLTPVSLVQPENMVGNEFQYTLRCRGLESGPVATKRTSMDRIKAIYR